jgi:hypothetical protein
MHIEILQGFDRVSSVCHMLKYLRRLAHFANAGSLSPGDSSSALMDRDGLAGCLKFQASATINHPAKLARTGCDCRMNMDGPQRCCVIGFRHL